jgi:predicted dithiol-disulfide oxidoreductase (DUF899 family)
MRTNDFGVTGSPHELGAFADIAASRAICNFGTVIRDSEDMFGASIFVKDENGDIFHSYSTYHRGTKLLMGAFNWLDLTPKMAGYQGSAATGGPRARTAAIHCFLL